jgi:hypothetical protein
MLSLVLATERADLHDPQADSERSVPFTRSTQKPRDRPVSLTCRVLVDDGRVWTVVAHARHQLGEARTAFGGIDGSSIGRLVDDDAGGFRS